MNSFPKVETQHLHYLLNRKWSGGDRVFTHSTKVTMSPNALFLFFYYFFSWCLEVYCVNSEIKSGCVILNF